jgi:hypothetical protein
MNSTDKEFIAEVYSLIVQIEELIKKYKYEDRVMSAMLIGVLDVDWDDEERTPELGDELQLKSVFSYNLDSSDELEVIKEIMTRQFQDESDNLDDLLGGMGISLN